MGTERTWTHSPTLKVLWQLEIARPRLPGQNYGKSVSEMGERLLGCECCLGYPPWSLNRGRGEPSRCEVPGLPENHFPDAKFLIMTQDTLLFEETKLRLATFWWQEIRVCRLRIWKLVCYWLNNMMKKISFRKWKYFNNFFFLKSRIYKMTNVGITWCTYFTYSVCGRLYVVLVTVWDYFNIFCQILFLTNKQNIHHLHVKILCWRHIHCTGH